MGGERASKTRMRLAGKICCWCGGLLQPPYTGKETTCAKCQDQQAPKRKVYMHFMKRRDWYCQFLEEDLKTPLPLKLSLDDTEKIRDMAQRGGASMILEDKQAPEYAFETGRGSVWLNLSPEQYAKLKHPARVAKARPVPRNRDGS